MADTIAEELRAWRETQRLSQTELARQLRITSSRLSNWERGIAEPPRKYLSKLMEMGFVPPGMPMRVAETRAPYFTRTTPTQLLILIETIYNCDHDADLRASARRELYKLLELEERGANPTN